MLAGTAGATRSYAAQTTTKPAVAMDDSTLQNKVEAALKTQPTLKVSEELREMQL